MRESNRPPSVGDGLFCLYLYRFFQFYFCNQTRRLGENFRGIALSHSSTGLGSRNDLSWKTENPRVPILSSLECTYTYVDLVISQIQFNQSLVSPPKFTLFHLEQNSVSLMENSKITNILFGKIFATRAQYKIPKAEPRCTESLPGQPQSKQS